MLGARLAERPVGNGQVKGNSRRSLAGRPRPGEPGAVQIGGRGGEDSPGQGTPGEQRCRGRAAWLGRWSLLGAAGITPERQWQALDRSLPGWVAPS